ncbi:MAG: hypothetical protein Q9184_002559 [Pyrenodesmia sp. 2 TL-2023]
MVLLFKPALWSLSFLALICFVHGGHNSWEPSTRFNAAQDGVAAILDKRYFIIEVNEKQRTWPNAEIKYCFKDAATKALLLSDLQMAKEKWYAQGLPNRFKYTEVSQTELNNNRARVLLITHNDAGRLATTNGMRALDPADPNYRGPTMQLSNREDVGMLDKAANYAHELGHAWGLLHEHQNPAWWGPPYATAGFGEFTFNCQNLRDYAEVAARLSPEDLAQACIDRNAAAAAKFSGAAEYLPVRFGGLGESFGFGGDPDMASIMLYPSGAGGLGPAARNNDGRMPVLLRTDDSSIPRNLDPSTKDVEGILRLYPEGQTPDPKLLNEPSNPKSGKFRTLYNRLKKDKGDC